MPGLHMATRASQHLLGHSGCFRSRLSLGTETAPRRRHCRSRQLVDCTINQYAPARGHFYRACSTDARFALTPKACLVICVCMCNLETAANAAAAMSKCRADGLVPSSTGVRSPSLQHQRRICSTPLATRRVVPSHDSKREKRERARAPSMQ